MFSLNKALNPTINLPLHGGHAPPYLIKRMIKLSYTISKVIIDEYGPHEFLRRLSDPLWFQAFGCVLGFDWHSSGVTTVVTGVLKQAIKEDIHGISIAGGKGRRSMETKYEIPKIAEMYYNLSSSKIDKLLYASKMAAKVDNSAIQDGYSLYHHAIFFDGQGDWTIVQQGMDTKTKMARRYHWISDNLKNFVTEPHMGIISENKRPNTLNMTSIDSKENQRICVELVKGDIQNLQSSVYRIAEITKKSVDDRTNSTLDTWLYTNHNSSDINNNYSKLKETKVIDQDSNEHYEMPRRLDWDLFKKIYDIQPKDYEELISIQRVGPASVRALSLIGEIIFGTKASWQDPVKFNFAHGGKDGVPYPVARKTYDKSISYLTSAIEGAEIQREEKVQTLKRLANFSNRMFNNNKDR